MNVYVNPKKMFKAENQRLIRLKDVAEIYFSESSRRDFEEAVLLNIDAKTGQNYLVTILDIVKVIVAIEEKATVINVGESDVIVEFRPNPRRENRIINFLKIFAVSIVLFFGAATAIMSFHADSDIPKLLEGYYEMFYEDNTIPYVIEIPYSIGLALGIIVFFNHFSKIQMSLDPTPIEVQMTTYEKEVLGNQIDVLESKKENR